VELAPVARRSALPMERLQTLTAGELTAFDLSAVHIVPPLHVGF